ncbi:oligosaccharide flippase family protein [Pseudescherichia sp.]|uniref:oligosaccharide flippase family protein n=1 Tax=Pseudescherichia sp. TaxID=2055881 RepID=UPI0028968F0D|nr:oligosaccharide flippase family protein [Pseudescherichia sp.]
MNLYKKILVDNFSLIIQYFFGGVTVLYVSPLIIKKIGLYDYGKIALVLSAVSYISLIVQYSFNMIGPKLIAENEDRNSVFNKIFTAKIVLFLFSAFIFMAYFYGYSKKYSFEYLLFILMPLSWVLNSVWYLQSNGRFIASSICSIAGSLFTLLIAYLFIKNSSSLFLPILCLILSAIINGLLTFLMARKYIVSFCLMNPLPVLKNGLSLFFSQIISALYTMSGVFVITHFEGLASGGIYSATEKFMNLFISLGVLTHVAAYPKLARLFRENIQKYYKVIYFVIVLYTVFMVAITSLVLIFNYEIQLYIFGKYNLEIRYMLYSACLLMFFSIYGPVITGYLTLNGAGKVIIIINSATAILSLILGIIMLNYIGAEGWLIGLALAQIINFSCFFYNFIWKKIKRSVFLYAK